MTEPRPLLSLCIPTYNRAAVLDETLAAIFADPDYDPAKVEVVVSDNCSTDHTHQIAERYPAVRYFRNEENIRDANFSLALLRGEGEYLRLMNDTVRFLPGSLRTILETLEECRASGETVFFYERSHRCKPRTMYCRTLGEFVTATSYRATWIANFGVWRRDLPIVEDVSSCATQLLQVDWSYRIAAAGPVRVRLAHYVSVAALPPGKGGYNIFRVFVENYFSISRRYVKEGKLSRWDYERNKFTMFNNYFVRRVVWLLFRSERIIHADNRGAWGIIMRHYGYHLYFYLWVLFYGVLYMLKGFR